jgi:hypothetical protein
MQPASPAPSTPQELLKALTRAHHELAFCLFSAPAAPTLLLYIDDPVLFELAVKRCTGPLVVHSASAFPPLNFPAHSVQPATSLS